MYQNVMLRDIKDIERLVKAARSWPYNLYVHSDDDSIMIDAKSLLSLYLLLNKPAKLVVDDYVEPKVFKRLIKKCGLAA